MIALAKQRGTPLRVGVNSGSLPKHLRQLEYDNPVEALVTAAIETVAADGAPGLHELQGLDEVDLGAQHDRLQPDALRAHPLPAAPRRHRGRHEVVGLAEVGRRPRHAAGRRDRRHDPHLALDLPRRGGGEGRLGDPQGAEAARARPRPDRLPDLRAAAVRHGHRRRRGRAAPGSLRGPDRGLGAGLRGQRHRRGAPRRLRHHRRQGHGHDLLQGRAAEEGPHRAARRRAVQGDRPLLRGRQDRPARRGRAPPRRAPGSPRTRTRRR